MAMELREFVSETLKQIIDGIVEAQKYAGQHGGAVNPHSMISAGDGVQTPVIRLLKSHQPLHEVEFDVALTSTEGTETKGGIGVFFGPISAGSGGKSSEGQTSMSRIRFSVPILLPIQQGQEQVAH